MKTWDEAIKQYGAGLDTTPSYREGYRAGWLDASMGEKSVIALDSHYGRYADGYRDGQRDRKANHMTD